MFRLARNFLLASFGFAAFAGQTHAQFKSPIKTPKIELPSSPPVKLPPVKLPPPPPIKLPPVKLPPAPVLPPVKLPPVKLPPAPEVKLPPVKLPPVKVPPLVTLKPPPVTEFTDPPSTPGSGKKPTQVGPQLGNSVPGIVIPTPPRPPVKPPVPGTATKPGTNVNVIVIPTGLLGGLNRPGGSGRPPVIVNPQPVIVNPQPVVYPQQPVVIPQQPVVIPAPTPEPVQTTAGTEQPEPVVEQPIPEGTPTALQITEVTARGPAARAGLQVGDVIVAINGKRVETIAALNAALLRGTEVEVMFVNPDDGKADTCKLKVTADIGLGVKRIAVAEK